MNNSEPCGSRAEQSEQQSAKAAFGGNAGQSCGALLPPFSIVGELRARERALERQQNDIRYKLQVIQDLLSVLS